MNAKDYLMQVKRLDYLIKNKQDEIEKLKAMTLNGENYGGERVSTSPNPQSQENLYIKIIEFKNRLESDVIKSIELKKEIISVIDKVTNADYVYILHERYLNFKTWEEIAVEMNYTYRWITELHGRALIEVEKILNTSY